MKLKRIHPLDAYSLSLDKSNKIQAMDQGLSIGITETYIEETDILKDRDIIQKKKKKGKMKKKDNGYNETPTIQLT